MLPINLEIAPRLAARLKGEARNAFPRESFAYLLGTNAGTLIAVEDIWIPEDLESHTDHKWISIQPHWIVEAQIEAEEDGLEVVGDWHSHPYYRHEMTRFDGGPSEGDCRYGWHGVCGLCVVLERKSGLVSRNYWYGPQTPLIVKEAA